MDGFDSCFPSDAISSDGRFTPKLSIFIISLVSADYTDLIRRIKCSGSPPSDRCDDPLTSSSLSIALESKSPTAGMDAGEVEGQARME